MKNNFRIIEINVVATLKLISYLQIENHQTYTNRQHCRDILWAFIIVGFGVKTFKYYTCTILEIAHYTFLR